MNKQLLSNATEDFILKYRAAVKVKLTKEQFANYLGIKPKSVLRRKQEIGKTIGLQLPFLISNKTLPLTDDIINGYETVLYSMADGYIKSEKVNNVNDKLKTNIKPNQRYVITSAQNATPIHEGFLKSLKTYCAYNDAQLLIIPYRYKNPTSVFTDSNQDWWHNSLSEYIITDEIKVGKHIRIMGNIKIQPTATSPLSGFDTVVGLDSAIFGHPNVELKMVPSVPGKMPKMLVTTGSITSPNYTDSKAGHKGAFNHSYSAVVLEINDNETFHIRHVTADNRGFFHDLDKKYTWTNVETNVRVTALVAGDSHAEIISQEVKNALYNGNNSIAETLKPQYMIFHDLIEMGARNHHTVRNTLGQFVKHYFDEHDNVENSLQYAADLLDEVSKPFAQNIVIKSNHDEHLDRWLNEMEPNIDPENARFYHYLRYHQYKAAQEKKKFDVFEFWTKNPDQYRGMANDRTRFLQREESFELNDVELSLHGDLGVNGARGSLRALSRLGQKMIIGHSHSPGIIQGTYYQTGTSTPLRLDYNRGVSTWLNTAAILYPDGNITLIHIIDGAWKL